MCLPTLLVNLKPRLRKDSEEVSLNCYKESSRANFESNLTLHFSIDSSVSKSNIQGFGDKIVVHDESGERTQEVGAGGWGGGVRLATSDEETQEINRVNLERFLKKQRRLRRKRERETQQNEDDANS